GGPLVLCYLLRLRPLVFGLGLGVLLVIADMPDASSHTVLLHQERTFFGVLNVKFDRDLDTHRLIHGNTDHGAQWWNPDKRDEPMTYYHRKGPIGDLFNALQGPNSRSHIAVTGLGAGALASYAQPGQSLTFYEIDPAVVMIALDPNYFTYCEDAKRRGVDLQMEVGDGRLNMARTVDGLYDLVILDAFSSDSLPVHLITREAFELYLRKMTRNGVIAVNISNRYLHIAPVLGNLAEELHLVGLHRHDHEDEDIVPGKYASHWVVVAKQREALGTLLEDKRWEPIPKNPALGVWTDNFSNVLSVFDWRS
ncbi:MAG: fused MFS/spermidine synthase, partial [Nitrospirota bacterium]|nr:fused MFS/spermidine synthase [Nitrospirota bacterium]